MPTSNITILLAPAAAGKTAAALRKLHVPRRGRAMLLLPSALHRQRLAEQLAAIPRLASGTLGYAARRLLGQAGEPNQSIGPALRTALLRGELRTLAAAGRLPRLGAVATKPGFVAEALRLIDELQDGVSAPEALASAGVSPNDEELAAIYAAYRTSLERRDLRDGAGLLHAAQAVLQARPQLLELDLLVVDGFDQFTALQLRLLSALAERAAETLITLTGDEPGRPAHQRFARTLEALRAALPTAQIQLLGPLSASDEHQPLVPALAHIERQLFALDPPALPDAHGAVLVIDAPDREREVRAALRRVKTLLAAGEPAEQIGLLFREPTRYAPLLREVAAEYELPLALYEGEALGAAPPVTALRELLALPAEGYRRRALVASWRALGNSVMNDLLPANAQLAGPAGQLPFATAAALLDRASRDSGVTRGLPRLRALLGALAAADPPLADDAQGPPIHPAAAAQLLALLDAFTAWLTPPEHAAPTVFGAWLQGLLGWDASQVTENRGQGTGGQEAVGEPWAADEDWAPDEDWWVADDIGALDNSGMAMDAVPSDLRGTPSDLLPFTPEQRGRLRALLAERVAIARLLDEPPQAYAAFVAELGAALDAARYGRVDPGPGKIAALPTLAARGAAFAHLVVLGTVDGELPARLPEPPFYTRRERAMLAARGAAPAPANPGDERSLFYETVTRARSSLCLSYTRLDESGNALEPSPYARALVGLFDAGVVAQSILAGSVPTPEQAASPSEALIALAARFGRLALGAPPAGVAPALVAHVERAAAVELAREGLDAYGPYEGALDDPAVQALLAEYFGPQHHWSVTQINDYTLCPFRFAAGHVLRLAPRDDLDEGLERAGRGRLFHAVLARAGERWARENEPFDAAHEEPIVAALAAAADEVFAVAPQTYGFEPGPFWAWEQADLRQSLARAVRRALRDNEEWQAFRPAGVEAGFGMGRGQSALAVETASGPVLVAGRIDRIDQDGHGRLALIDYKSSSAPRSLEDTLNGRDVQLTVYALAAEQLLAPGQRVEKAAFLHLGSGKRGRALTPTERPRAEEALRLRLDVAVAGSRAGQFPVRPSANCPPACAFASICRLNRAKADSVEHGD